LIRLALYGNYSKLSFVIAIFVAINYALVSIMPLFTLQYHNKTRICVIGDMMLDHHINGLCNLISAAAPEQLQGAFTWTMSVGSNR